MQSMEKLRVLVVEDHNDARDMLVAMLKEIGVRDIHTAGNGEEGMQLLDRMQNAIDVVLCDWNMPRMHGLDFLKNVRSVYPAMPFLLVTGRADPQSQADARAAGASSLLAKPFNASQLEARIRIAQEKRLAAQTTHTA